MAPIFRTDHTRVFDGRGNLISDTTAQVDVTAETNQATLHGQVDTALDVLRTYAALPAPTAAQTTAQVKAQARILVGLIRLIRGALDDVT